MGNLTENPTWTAGVPYFEADAELTGGPDCPDNIPIQALANRTAFLKKQIDEAVSGALVMMYAGRLRTGRLISLCGEASGSAVFDGSANISIPVVVADDSHNHTIGTINGLQGALDAKVGKDAQGNIGIGVVPRTWGAQYPVIQQNTKTVYAADANSSYYGTNWYHTDGTYKRLAAGFALQYQQDSAAGKHLWKTATSDVADSIVAFTTAMSLDIGTGILDVPGGITTTTPAAGDNSLKAANTAFVQAAIAALVNSSPAALDTLNELAVALGNDPNFAATMTNALAGKVGKDAQGNIGLGVIPKTWDAQYPVIQQNTKTVYAADANSSYYGTNWYHTDGTYKRLAAGFALQYQQDSSAGKHLWKTAPSDAADSIVAFTTAMSLDVGTGILDVPAGVTTATQEAGDNSIAAATTAFVHNATIGNGQTWQAFSVGTQRVVGTTYYNATGKPIVIAISWYMSTSALYYLHAQGVVAGEAGGNGAALVRGQLFAIIPPGAPYLLEQSTGSLAIEYWSELR